MVGKGVSDVQQRADSDTVASPGNSRGLTLTIIKVEARFNATLMATKLAEHRRSSGSLRAALRRVGNSSLVYCWLPYGGERCRVETAQLAITN